MLSSRSIALVCAVAIATFFVVSVLGPLRRGHVAPARVVAIASPAEVHDLLLGSGVRGRIGLLFAGDLVPAAFGLTESERASAAPRVEAIERAMHEGLLREVQHVVPEAAWPALSMGLGHVSIYRRAGGGWMGAFEDGRVHVLPLGGLWPVEEEVVVLIDAAAWSPPELEAIVGLFESGAVRADLIAVVGENGALLDRLAAAQRGR